MIGAPIYTFQRGEPIVIARQVQSGDPAGYTVSAALKRTSGQVVPKAEAPVVANFAVQFEAAAGGVPARWVLTIPGAQAAALGKGDYATDARFMLGGDVAQITGPAFIRIIDSVSG